MGNNNVTTTANTETRTAKLIFRLGTYRNEKHNIDEERFISKLEGKIVYGDPKKVDIKVGVSYICELKLSPKGKAYDVVSATKTPVIKANLVFKKGRRMHNEKTDDYVENMVSSFDGEIVIAPESFNIEPYKEYSVEMVLSPNGKAYIVEYVEPARLMEAHISCDETEFSVAVTIDGKRQNDLQFDSIGGDEKMLQSKISILRMKNISDKDMVVSNYEATCQDMMKKFLSKIN